MCTSIHSIILFYAHDFNYPLIDSDSEYKTALRRIWLSLLLRNPLAVIRHQFCAGAEEGYDYAKGNRFLLSESLGTMPKHQLFGNIVLTLMAKLASGYWHIFDSENGYTAIKAHALRALDFHSIHKRYFFADDMLIQLNLHDFRVKDVPIPARYGKEESSCSCKL